jgi:hypothetical protein
VDQGREMPANFSSNINVKPILFEEEERESFTLKHRTEGDDLILQVVPKRTLSNLGARVAKAIVSTIGEAGMSKVRIEEISDESFEDNHEISVSVYVRCAGYGSDYYQNMILANLFENLQDCLSARQG